MMIRLTIVLLVLLLGACAQYDNKRGVEVAWTPEQMSHLRKGETTRQEVLELLGPPSQLIALSACPQHQYKQDCSQPNHHRSFSRL